MGFFLGIGIEKRFQHGLALSGEYNIKYTVSKFEWEHSKEYEYWHSFSHAPKISLKYYIIRKKKLRKVKE